MEVKEIIELMKAMSENGMTGFELEEGDWKLSMKREKKIVAAAQTPVVMQVPGQGSMILLLGKVGKSYWHIQYTTYCQMKMRKRKFPESPRK